MALTEQYDDDASEVLKRVRRIETKLGRLGEGLKIDVDPEKRRVTMCGGVPKLASLSGLDVSVSDLLDALRKSGINDGDAVVLYCNQRRIGMFSALSP